MFSAFERARKLMNLEPLETEYCNDGESASFEATGRLASYTEVNSSFEQVSSHAGELAMTVSNAMSDDYHIGFHGNALLLQAA